MEIFEPRNFFQLTEAFTNIFTGVIACVGLLIALKTYEVAIKALGEWKNQKKFEIDVEGYAFTIDALKTLEDLRLDQYNPEFVKTHSEDILDDIKSAGEMDAYNSYVKLFSYSKYYNDLKPQIFEVRKKALIIFNQSDDSELIDFYDSYISFEANIFSIHHNYHTYIINKFVDKYQYSRIAKEKPAINIYFNSLKMENPDYNDFEIHSFLYKKFFLYDDEDDWLENMRKKHISFYL